MTAHTLTDTAPAFVSVARLEPSRLRVFPGTLLTQGTGTLLSWRKPE